MKPNNLSERRKRLFTFGGLYLASILLLVVIFSAFGFQFSKAGSQRSHDDAVNRLSIRNDDFTEADSVLHTGLHALQLADAISMTVDDTALSQKANAALLVKQKELSFANTLDSLETLDASGKKGNLYRMMIVSFRSALHDRQALKQMELSLAARNINNGADLSTSVLLAAKDDEINRLQWQLKNQQRGTLQTVIPAGREEAQKGEVELLKTAFNDLQSAYDKLNDRHRQLTSEHAALQTSAIALRRAQTSSLSTPVSNSASAAATNALEQKLAALNADLNFANIDCNLARVDAQQMISNARQRKELLTTSLRMLQTLAASGDEGIQKKAKERIARLNLIANTLHD